MFTVSAIKFKVAAFVAIVSAEPVGKHDMVSRASQDVYSIVGVGTVRTRGCTIDARNMHAEVERDGWIAFYDDNGELEDRCELESRRDVKPRTAITGAERFVVVRTVAVTE